MFGVAKLPADFFYNERQQEKAVEIINYPITILKEPELKIVGGENLLCLVENSTNRYTAEDKL